jgi:hypothetical protein
VILKEEYERKPYNESFIDGNELKYIKLKYKNNQDSSFVIEYDDNIV